MAADNKLAGCPPADALVAEGSGPIRPVWDALTDDQWSTLDPQMRAQLLQVSLGLDESWRLHGTAAPVPLPTARPGLEPDTVIIHAAAPVRAPTNPPPRRARRTSDID